MNEEMSTVLTRALWLASSEAFFITRTTLMVDGGLRII